MSIKTFLSKIWAQVETLFTNMPAEIKTAAHIAVTIVENIKTIVNNPAIDLLTAIIPGDTDDKLLAWLRNRLPVILTGLRLADSNADTGISITASAVTVIQNLDGDIKNAFLHDLAILIVRETAKALNNELTWEDAVYVIEWYYQHQFKKAG